MDGGVERTQMTDVVPNVGPQSVESETANVEQEAPFVDLWLTCMRSNDAETLKDLLPRLTKLAKNIVSKPQEPKFRQLRISNRVVQQKLISPPGSRSWLGLLGFKTCQQDGTGEAVLTLDMEAPLEPLLASERVLQAIADGKVVERRLQKEEEVVVEEEMKLEKEKQAKEEAQAVEVSVAEITLVEDQDKLESAGVEKVVEKQVAVVEGTTVVEKQVAVVEEVVIAPVADDTPRPLTPPCSVKKSAEKKKKKSKKSGYAAMMAGITKGKGKSQEELLQKQREKIAQCTGGGTFKKLDKI